MVFWSLVSEGNDEIEVPCEAKMTTVNPLCYVDKEC